MYWWRFVTGVKIAKGSAAAISKVAISNGHCIVLSSNSSKLGFGNLFFLHPNNLMTKYGFLFSRCSQSLGDEDGQGQRSSPPGSPLGGGGGGGGGESRPGVTSGGAVTPSSTASAALTSSTKHPQQQLLHYSHHHHHYHFNDAHNNRWILKPDFKVFLRQSSLALNNALPGNNND